MQFVDFEYDGQTLSSWGYIVCIFDQSDGVDVIESGDAISFEKTPVQNGVVFELTNTKHEECITSTFDICKDPDVFDDLIISDHEYRKLSRWLNRKEFFRFKPLDDELENCFYDASFNVNKIKIADKLVGLELKMETNRPFGYNHISYKFSLDSNTTKTIYDESDEIGYLYPKMKIEILEDGDLTLNNSFDNSNMTIRNCKKDEVITINYPVICSNFSEHRIQNDFDWKFLRISNTYDNRINTISSTIACNIRLAYDPIVKVGI